MVGSVFSSPRTHLDPPAPKKLKEDEIKASAERLSSRKEKEIHLPPLVERKVLSQPVLQQSLDRLYTNTIAHRKTMMEQLDKKAHPDMIKHTTLDSETLQSAFNRLHDRAMASKEENMKKLREKYLHEGKHKAISADEVKNSANRLCNESISHMQENHKKLFEKYVEATSTKFPKLTAEQLKASADRLSKKDK